MAKQHETKEIRDTIGALGVAGVSCPDIHQRLAEGNAGLPNKVKLSLRSVQYHWRKYQIEHAAELKKDDAAESIEAIKARSVALVAREVATLEHRRPGSLSVNESRALLQHHKTLDGMAKTERKGPMGRPKRNGSSAPDDQDEVSESPLQRLAREEAEGPLQTTPQNKEGDTSAADSVGPSQSASDGNGGVEPNVGNEGGGQSWFNAAADMGTPGVDHQASRTTPAKHHD